jgi:hypothetical protein
LEINAPCEAIVPGSSPLHLVIVKLQKKTKKEKFQRQLKVRWQHAVLAF